MPSLSGFVQWRVAGQACPWDKEPDFPQIPSQMVPLGFGLTWSKPAEIGCGRPLQLAPLLLVAHWRGCPLGAVSSEVAVAPFQVIGTGFGHCTRACPRREQSVSLGVLPCPAAAALPGPGMDSPRIVRSVRR